MHGIRSKTHSYRIAYLLAWPLLPLFRVLLPGAKTTTERMGLAMLNAVRTKSATSVLASRDINRLARGALPA
jgi:hypothetical protein